jgi:hypothetical protein
MLKIINYIRVSVNKFLYKKMTEYPEEIFYPNVKQYWISTNKDKKLKIYNSSQAINLYDYKIPIYYEIPCPEPEDIDSIIPSTEEEITDASKAEPDRIIKKEIFKTRKFLRGRKRMGSVNIDQIKIHDKISKDNILRKFNVYFLTFVIDLANKIVEFCGFEGKFIDLDYSFKKNITKKSLSKLKSLTFGELLCKNISKKYRKHSFNENEIFYKKVIENENIKKIFSEKYMTIFGIFLKSQRNIKIGHYDFDLSPKINMFDSFLSNIENKYKNDDSYIKKIKEVIQDY